MDSHDPTSIIFSRIQSLDPENASKIMGYILFQDFGEKEKMKLAFGPDNLLLSLIIQAKAQLGLSSNSSSTPSSPSPFSPISNLTRPNPLTQSSSRIIIPKNGFHMNPSSPSSPWSLSGFSDHRSPNSHLSPRPASSLSYAAVVNGTTNGASGSFSSSPNTSFSVPFYSESSCNDLNDEYSNLEVHNQLSFLDESSLKNTDFMDPIMSPGGRSDSFVFPYGNTASNWVDSGNCGDSHHHQLHRRSCSVNDVFLSGGSDDGGSGLGWRPCVYFARGFCKNGNSCKFSHGGFADSLDASDAIVGSPSKIDGFDELLRMKAIQQQQHRFAAASHLMAGAPFAYNKGMNFLNDTQRSAAAALMLDEEFQKFGRCRPGRSEFSAMGLGGSSNSSARQIYLTFPADSTFKEEDVSNYFNIYGPVQDVRIPYQQKRMFGFVTFLHPETVRLILAKGNPHFVCDSRVLVKPYKEKGKLPDKKQQQQQLERGEFSRCLSPSGLDSRESCELPIGARMFYNPQEMLLRRKFEEQAELQQAIELQGRRLMNVQLMDLKNHHHNHQFQPNLSPSGHIALSAPPHVQINQSLMLPSDSINEEIPEDNNGRSDAANSPIFEAEQKLPQDLSDTCISKNGNYSGNDKEENLVDSDLPESLDHILPDNLFASPTKLAGDHHSSIFSAASVETDINTLITTTSSNSIPMLPNTSTL
ncbi:zinc finger CCCH domain-containing protein 55-like isoform X2 [Cornus florida]|uniref:zinc finger CCCH domain-containing protein 55-like isoform X2 n=1 Tax=Cornus florida TaxID=4283 RepID=UPI0028A24E77|nr:zinc finger CCCH domain-containing protein 55-like isoform X2 [Cornus florida]